MLDKIYCSYVCIMHLTVRIFVPWNQPVVVPILGWKKCGAVLVARTKDRITSFKRAAVTAR